MLATQAAISYGTGENFADQVLGMPLDDANGFCAAQAASSMNKMLHPIKVGAMMAYTLKFTADLSIGLAVLARSVTRGFSCAILAHLSPV